MSHFYCKNIFKATSPSDCRLCIWLYTFTLSLYSINKQQRAVTRIWTTWSGQYTVRTKWNSGLRSLRICLDYSVWNRKNNVQFKLRLNTAMFGNFFTLKDFCVGLFLFYAVHTISIPIFTFLSEFQLIFV